MTRRVPVLACLGMLGIVPVAKSTSKLATRPEIFGDKGKDIPVVSGIFGAEDASLAAALKPSLVIGLGVVSMKTSNQHWRSSHRRCWSTSRPTRTASLTRGW